MICAHCQHFDTTTHPKHWALGFGQCKAASAGVFMAVERESDCPKFAQASEEVISQRRADWAKRKKAQTAGANG